MSTFVASRPRCERMADGETNDWRAGHRYPSASSANQLRSDQVQRLLPLLVAVLLLSACARPEAPANSESLVPAVRVATDAENAIESDSSSVAIHARIFRAIEERGMGDRPIGEVIQFVAEQLVGTAYVAHMLDQDDEESLVVSLTGFDCVLFNESVVALAMAIRDRDRSFETFARNVESLRYRDGRMTDYCSRLHYYTDWLRDNARRGNIRVVTDELRTARPFDNRVSFMTSNRSAYRQLADDELFACVAEVQLDLSREPFTYIPQNQIEQVYDQLQPGDLLALTTGIAGLDIAHTGIVFRHADGGIGMIHASTTGEVKIERDLATYVRRIRNQTGMMVARVLEAEG